MDFSEDSKGGDKRLEVLETGVRKFLHAQSIWPEGLLFEEEPATMPQVIRMKSDLQSVRKLDQQGAYREFLDGFETKLNILIGQLRSDEGKCFF